MQSTRVYEAFTKQNISKGKAGESLIATWLRNKRQCLVVPTGDIEANGRGPRMFLPGVEELVLPDLLTFPASGRPCWVEAKHKSVWSWHRLTGQWTGGINTFHYQQYLQVAERTGFPVWLFMLVMNTSSPKRPSEPWPCPTGLFAADLAKLATCVNHTAEPRTTATGWGNSGMTYWAIQAFAKVASLEEVQAAAGLNTLNVQGGHNGHSSPVPAAVQPVAF